MAEKITDKLVAKLQSPESGYAITYDDEVSGFGVRVTAAGAKSFILRYRTRSGRDRTYTIGPAGEGGWKTGRARERSKDLKARIRSEGCDPVGEIEAERGAPTVEHLANRFLEEHAAKKRQSTREQYQRSIAQYILPALRHRKVAEVDYADADGLHRNVTEKAGPYAANRVVACGSKMFNLAKKRWKWCDANPFEGVERNVEEKRKRYLDGDEIARLSDALEQHKDQQAANIIRLLLFTGARKGEILAARWDQFDLKAKTWTKPSSETKQKRDHTTAISAAACQLLAGVYGDAKRKAKKKDRALSPFVFPARVGSGHRVEIKKDWAELCRAAGIVTTETKTVNGKTRTIVKHSARPHDLRHTFASLLVSGGKSLELIGAVLGHSQISTTQRYSHLYLDAQREAVETAASIIAPGGQGAAILKYPKGAS